MMHVCFSRGSAEHRCRQILRRKNKEKYQIKKSLKINRKDH